MKDNANKSGVYRWVNNISKNTYVGSSINLSNRLNRYYHNSELTKKNARPINQALLKYGHNNFSLEILEYCSKDILPERENFYLDNLKPEYNILKFAYSMLGYKHSAESILKLKLKKVTVEHKQIISLTHKNKIVSEETRKKLSSAIADFRKKNPLSPDKLTHLKTSAIKRQRVSVLNNKTLEIINFTSQTKAGNYLGVTRQAIHNAMVKNKPILEVYTISKITKKD